jgi:CMP-N,N'-diacetyllegionaminic acid synthase
MNNLTTIDYLAIIPARGGSKRLPGKNIKPLNGKPLIGYSIQAALEADKISHTIVSTDDADIAQCAKIFGADVPFLRPADIAGDKSSVVDALRHAVQFYEDKGVTVKNVVLLQVTSPFRKAQHINDAISAFEKQGADALTTVSPAKNHPYYALKGDTTALEPFFDKEKLAMGAFELPSACYENGVVFIMKKETLMKDGIYGDHNMIFMLDGPDMTVDIDTLSDFELAEFMLVQREK